MLSFIWNDLIYQPIYNTLVAIYGLLPGHDLGLSIVIFTVLVRLLMWPLLKKQLHQSKIMRELQPELKKIKKAAVGDKQKEGMLMMELYKEKGISPFGTMGLTLVQLPLFIAVFHAARDLAENFDKIKTLTYPFVRDLPHIQSVLANKSNFSYESLGFIDLSKKAIDGGNYYLPLIVVALIATALSYIQAKQILPSSGEKKKLRDILRSSATSGKQPDQEDISAAMGGTMSYLMPVMTILFAISARGAMIVYLLASSAIAIFQQATIFKKDTGEMEAKAEVLSVKKQPLSNPPSSTNEPKVKIKKGKITTKTRVMTPSSSPKKAAKKKRRK